MLGMFSAWIFDLDGTLVHSGDAGPRALARAIRDVLPEIGGAVTDGGASLPEGFSPHGKTDPLIFRELYRSLARRPPSAAELARCRDTYLEYLAEEVARSGNEYAILPGVTSLLDHLAAAGILVGLGTGNYEEGARIKLAASGLWPRFSFGGYGSDAETRPEMLRAALRRASAVAGHVLSPSEVVVLGDTPRDIIAARAFGAPVIAVATGFDPLESLRDADLAVPTLESPEVGRFFHSR
jgi:phosphoglycolate phosphatase-like HAD superfamily hydrolase